MKPLDLTKTPPREPREKMLGVYFLPRTVDKICGELPGGNPGHYFVDNPIGMSAYVLKKLKVDLADLRAVVAAAADERDVEKWIGEHADLSDVESLNAKVSNVTVGMMPASNREFFNSLYPGAEALPDATTIFDVIELDDAKLV